VREYKQTGRCVQHLKKTAKRRVEVKVLNFGNIFGDIRTLISKIFLASRRRNRPKRFPKPERRYMRGPDIAYYTKHASALLKDK